MRPLISIGRFAQLTGLSVRALRLYEQQGLLRPAVVDPQTGYRFYRWHQRAVAERIRTLRELDLPLDVIAECLHAGLRVADALEMQEAQLRAEIRERQGLLARVQEARVRLPLPEFEVGTRVEAAQPLLVVSYRTALRCCEADRRDAYRELKRRATRLGTRDAGPPFAQHPPQGGFNPEDYLVKLSLPVRDAVAGTEAGYAGLVAFTRQRGDLTRLLHAYQAVTDWIRLSGYQRAGPAAERYLCRLRPNTVPDTEIWQPIRFREEDV